MEKPEKVTGSYGRLRSIKRERYDNRSLGNSRNYFTAGASDLSEWFSERIAGQISKRTGEGVLCNLPYSGTDVIRDYGEEHIRTGKLIVYTSADSVFSDSGT